MWLTLFRVFMVALLAHAGYFYTPMPGEPLVGAGLGVLAALAVITLEIKLRGVPGHHMIGALAGGVTGLVGASLLWGGTEMLNLVPQNFILPLLIVILVHMRMVLGT